MPGESNCPLSFMQQVVTGEKDLILEVDINFMKVPKWPEFGITRMWPHAVKNPAFVRHMPDTWGPGHRAPERLYFFKVLATVERDWLWGNILRITNERESRRMIEVPKAVPTLHIPPDWLKNLMEFPVALGK